MPPGFHNALGLKTHSGVMKGCWAVKPHVQRLHIVLSLSANSLDWHQTECSAELHVSDDTGPTWTMWWSTNSRRRWWWWKERYQVTATSRTREAGVGAREDVEREGSSGDLRIQGCGGGFRSQTTKISVQRNTDLGTAKMLPSSSQAYGRGHEFEGGLTRPPTLGKCGIYISIFIYRNTYYKYKQ